MKSTRLYSSWTAFRHGPSSFDQAVKLARLACLGVAIRAAYTVFAFIAVRPSSEEVIAQLRRVRGPVTLDEAAIDQVLFERVANIFSWLTGTMTLAVIGICVGLGIWQWRRPGTAMPMVCLGIIAASTLLVLCGLQNEHVRAVALEPQNMILLGLKPILAIMMIAAYRGGRFCQQYRKANP